MRKDVRTSFGVVGDENPDVGVVDVGTTVRTWSRHGTRRLTLTVSTDVSGPTKDSLGFSSVVFRFLSDLVRDVS